MNIFIRELKANRKALMIWSICMVLFVLSGMSKYTTYSSGGTNSDIFSDFPKSIRVLFGFGSFDVTKISGFFAFLFTYIVLIVGIHAALLGSGIIAKEERDKTTEFLIVKPVSRRAIITSKLLAAILNIVSINVVTLLSSLIMVSALHTGDNITFEIIMFFTSLLLVQLIYLSLGAFLAACTSKPRASGSIATGILLVGYAISKVTDMTDKVNVLNLLSPFKYFSYERIVEGDGLNIVIVLVSLLMTAVFTIAAYFFYLRRDLNV